MATNLFNYTNQKLNAEQHRVINGFNSFNFAGIIGDSSPFTVLSNNTVQLVASESSPVTFLGGGLILTQDSTMSIDMSTANRLAYLRVVLSDDGTVASDEYNGVSLRYMSLNSFDISNSYTIYTVVEEASGSPAANNYYEYSSSTGAYTLSTSETVDSSVTYYIKFEASTFTFSSTEYEGTTFRYNGNTLWLSSNTFMIPLLVRGSSTDITEVIAIKNLKDLATFLSLDAYNALKTYCEGIFVWTEGGQDEVTALDGTTHKKGDIGGLNVTGTTILNNTNNGTSESPVYDLPVSFANIKITELIGNSDGKNQKLYVDTTGQLKMNSDYKVSISEGGLYNSANEWDTDNPYLSAKTNLHIKYGTGEPGTKYNTPLEGDIYLKIIE